MKPYAEIISYRNGNMVSTRYHVGQSINAVFDVIMRAYLISIDEIKDEYRGLEVLSICEYKREPKGSDTEIIKTASAMYTEGLSYRKGAIAKPDFDCEDFTNVWCAEQFYNNELWLPHLYKPANTSIIHCVAIRDGITFDPSMKAGMLNVR